MREQVLIQSATQPAWGLHAEGRHHAEDKSPHHRPSRRLRSPLVWFGGKGILARKIVSLFPHHHSYVEPFCGGASCLFAKPPSPVEVINDVDSDIVNFFRVLRDPRKFEQFHRLTLLTPYSREEYYRYRAEWRAGWGSCLANRDAPGHGNCSGGNGGEGGGGNDHNSQGTDLWDVERAYRWYVLARMSFSGEVGRSWGRSIGTSRLGMANAVAQWLSIVDMLPAIAERVSSVQIEHGDWLEVLQAYDSPGTLFYCDPPFVKSTRRGGKYRHEMDDAEHQTLVEALMCLRGKAVLSGYRNAIYRPLEEAGWRCVDMHTVCYAVGRTRLTGLQGASSLTKLGIEHLRTETLWISPSACTPTAGPAGLGFRRFGRSNRYIQDMFDFALES